METIFTLVVVDTVVAWWGTSISADASTAEAAVGVGTSGIDITVVCLTFAFINVHTYWAKITRVGVKMATVLELTHTLVPSFVALVASTSVATGAVPSVILTRGMSVTSVCLVGALINIRTSDVRAICVKASELLFTLILITCAHKRLTNIAVHIQVGTSGAWAAIISALLTFVDIDTNALRVFSVTELTWACVTTGVVETKSVWITAAVVIVGALVIVDAWLIK